MITEDIRVLVTGAGGFLGSHIVKNLLDNNHTVIAGTRNCMESQDVFLDICDTENVNQVVSKFKPQYVIHCAAYGVDYQERDPEKSREVNQQGSLNLLEASSQNRTNLFLHIGSCFEYGSHDGLISENARLHPTDIYGISKAAATSQMLARAKTLGVPLIVARPFGMWGPGEKPFRIVPQILRAHIDQTSVDLTACEVIRDYSYVEDMARWIVALCFSDRIDAGTIINVGSGTPVVLKDFVTQIASHLQCLNLINFGVLESRPTEMHSVVADVSRLHSIINNPEVTPLETGIQKMLLMMS